MPSSPADKPAEPERKTSTKVLLCTLKVILSPVILLLQAIRCGHQRVGELAISQKPVAHMCFAACLLRLAACSEHSGQLNENLKMIVLAPALAQLAVKAGHGTDVDAMPTHCTHRIYFLGCLGVYAWRLGRGLACGLCICCNCTFKVGSNHSAEAARHLHLRQPT